MKFKIKSKTIFSPNSNMLEKAMGINNQEDATQWFEQYVKYVESELIDYPRKDNKTAVDICKENLGYYAGYYGDETRERVERLFNCEHPIFGSIAKDGPLTPQQAFDLGQKFGEIIKFGGNISNIRTRLLGAD
jgi:hypothetical protein